ncbi:MAG: hypothetical protein WCK49_09770 [Myxococcaceae bacterium]
MQKQLPRAVLVLLLVSTGFMGGMTPNAGHAMLSELRKEMSDLRERRRPSPTPAQCPHHEYLKRVARGLQPSHPHPDPEVRKLLAAQTHTLACLEISEHNEVINARIKRLEKQMDALVEAEIASKAHQKRPRE